MQQEQKRRWGGGDSKCKDAEERKTNDNDLIVRDSIDVSPGFCKRRTFRKLLAKRDYWQKFKVNNTAIDCRRVRRRTEDIPGGQSPYFI